jgi:hypothetical protein
MGNYGMGSPGRDGIRDLSSFWEGSKDLTESAAKGYGILPNS